MRLSLPLTTILVPFLPLICVAEHTGRSRSALNKHFHTSNVTESTDNVDVQRRDDAKYVFMHHIVGNTYNYDYNAWVADFTRMGSQIDAVALNVGGDSWQWDRIVDAYNAGAETKTKLFISFDYTSFPCDVGLTTSWVNSLSNDFSAQFKVDGRPMISSYSGYCLGVDGWQSIRDETGGYLMPFFYGQDDQTLRSNSSFGFLDSWYCWGCAWPQGDYYKNTNDDHYYMDILGNRYATTVSAWMYTHYDYKNFLLLGDGWLLNNRWEQLINMRDKLRFVEIVTWNDFGESDYFGPLSSGLQPYGTTWADGFPHTGFFDMSAYYITAFKTGSYPIITDDTIYFWSRPHPAGIIANNDTLPKPSGWDWTSDTLWAAVFCSSTCNVTLTVGDCSETYDLSYGVNKIRLELNSQNASGPVTVTMEKDQGVVINHTTNDFQYRQWTEQYNYNAYVGSARVSDSMYQQDANSDGWIL